jgi:hypothetical protein
MDRMSAALEVVSPDEGFFSIHLENGIGEGIRLEDILPGKGKERLFHEHCNQAR